MKRLDDGTIALTQEELDNIHGYIRDCLRAEWTSFTNNVYGYPEKTDEEGMRRMNPDMYNLAQQLNTI